MGNSKRQLYQGTNGGDHGIIEHDCMNCERSWDLKSEYDDECPWCGSTDVVRREAFSQDLRTMFGNYYDGNGGLISADVLESEVQLSTQYDNSYINQQCWEG